ncbi:MAG: EamA family transporter [Deltaproteobacteria bacterium]|nr:MAG: EamA family transporter [Deltaproteobacteria bacterium]
MSNLLLFAATVLIWGSTWLAITFQLGSVDPMLSVGYRFLLAALLLFAWCRLSGHRLRFTRGEHGFILLQGLALFSCNYLLFYLAEQHLASGLVAVIFSTIVFMNVFNGALLLGAPVEPRVLVGALLGVAGLGLVFWPELAGFRAGGSGLLGVGLAFAASYLASLGNILSARNQRHGLPVFATNAWGMFYGAVAMLVGALLLGKPMQFDTSAPYLLSLVYLALFGSIVAFGCYLTLIGRIGAPRAAYASLIFPLVALLLSTVWEGYRWSGPAVAGVPMILFGNLLALRVRGGARRNRTRTGEAAAAQ